MQLLSLQFYVYLINLTRSPGILQCQTSALFPDTKIRIGGRLCGGELSDIVAVCLLLRSRHIILYGIVKENADTAMNWNI